MSRRAGIPGAAGERRDEMELTTAALAAKLCGVEADDELLGVLCAAAEQAWKNRLQSGVTPADCGSALPCPARQRLPQRRTTLASGAAWRA